MMIKIVLLLALAGVSLGAKTCQGKSGKKVITFGDTAELIKFPCKFNAIRRTSCGNWRVTITPGSMLETHRNKHYVLKSMWVSVERISNGDRWEGRTDLKIARKYRRGLVDEPFNTKGGNLEIQQIFNFASSHNEVTLKSKSGDFKISFGLYDPYGRWHKDSGFSFKCFSKSFEPSSYPDQLCGNGTKREVETFKKSQEWSDNRQATLFYNVFSDGDITQTDNNCHAAQQVVSKHCTYKGEDLRYKANLLCWPLVGQLKYQSCIAGNMDTPISAFRHCVEFVCSGYQDKDACDYLGKELDLCPELKNVTEVVKDTCMPSLVTR